jgi:alpha-tubulin suppressor-like RCC1 family protein
MSKWSWMRRFGVAMAVWSVLAALGGGTSAAATVAAVPATPFAWGYNGYGQLGNGNLTDSSTPRQVSSLSAVTAIAGGDFHSLALRSDGTVWAWGLNAAGELGNGTTTLRELTPV